MFEQSRTSRNSRRWPKTRAAAVVGAAGLLLAACGGGGGGGAAGGGGEGGEGAEGAEEGATAAASGCDKSEAFPNGSIQLLVPWAAGGGTDSVARFLGKELGEKLDTQVNVVNRTGGSGVVGHSAIAQAQPDGSTIGLATVELTMMHHQGLTDLTYEDLTAIAQVNSDPAGVTVAADAPWGDAKELIQAAQESPGEYTASGTGRGGIWHLALAGMLLEAGAEPDVIQWVPSEGAAPALQELVAGGIDVTTSSLVENRTMIEAGKVKPISIMAEEPSEKFPDVPTLQEQGIDFSMAAWRGIMGPDGMDEAVVAELECHLDEIVHGEEYQEFMQQAGFGIEWKGSEDFAEFVAQEDETKGEIMEASGLTP